MNNNNTTIMNTIFKTIAFGFFTLISIQATAQYGGGYGGGGMGGMGGGGMNGMGGSGMRGGGMQNNYGNTPKGPTVLTEKEKAEKIDKIMEKLKTQLNLDELQVFAIRNEVVANSKSIEAIAKSDSSNEDKTKEAEAVHEKTDRIINTYLNKDQKEKYKALIEERKNRALESGKGRRN